MRMVKSLILTAAFFLCITSLSSQVLGFGEYSWEQKDSVIATLFSGGAFNVSEVLIEEAYQTEKTKGDADAKALATFSAWQGVRYIAKQSLDTAQQYLEEALAIYSAKPELQDSAYRDVLLSLGDVMQAQNQWDQAKTYFTQAEQQMKKDGMPNRDLYLNTLTGILSSALQVQDLEQAEEYGKKALSFAQTEFGQKSDSYISALTNLGKVYESKGQTRRASNMILQAYELAKVNLPSDHVNRLIYANNAAEIYASLGRRKAVGQVYNEMIQYFEDNPGQQESTMYPTILDKQGTWHESEGDLDQAYEFYNRANILFSLRSERTSPEYIQSELNMANILRRQGKYLESEGYYNSALQYASQVYGSDSWSVAILQENIGDMFTEAGEHSKALEHRTTAVTLFEMHLQDDDPSYAFAIQKLGETHQKLELDSLAEENFLQAQGMLGDIYGPAHVALFENSLRLARYYWDKDAEKTLEFLNRAKSYAMYSLQHTVHLLSQDERTLVYNDVDALINWYGSLALKEATPAVLDALSELVVSKKNSLIQGDLVSYTTYQVNPTGDYRRKYNDWQMLRKEIFDAQNAPIKHRPDLAVKEKEAKQLQQELISGYRNYQVPVISASHLRNQLSSGTALVDLIEINLFDETKQSFAERSTYCALLHPGKEATSKFISLQLNQNALSTSQVRNQAAYYQQLWAPIEQLLGDVREVYICPTGVLHRISFISLPTQEGGYVMDKFDVKRVLSAAALSRIKEYTPAPTAMLFGDPAFSAIQDSSSTSDERSLLPPSVIGDLATRNQYNFSTITATAAEIKSVATLLEKKKWNVTSYLGQKATAPHFMRALQETDGLLHVTTRTYLPTSATSGNAGLAFSGIRRQWQDTVQRIESLVSAMEIGAVSADEVDLLILGYEEVDGGEALAALQRAFHFAGVKTSLTCLWDVPDASRMAFFKLFYKNLAKKQSVQQALQNTRKKIRKKSDPIDWAGFVLVQ